MTFDEAVKIATANPGQGIREKCMRPGWKIVYLRLGKSKASGALFCISPITGGHYEYSPTDDEKASNWSLI